MLWSWICYYLCTSCIFLEFLVISFRFPGRERDRWLRVKSGSHRLLCGSLVNLECLFLSWRNSTGSGASSNEILSFWIQRQMYFISVLLGASALGIVSSYPLFKRFTCFPQAALGEDSFRFRYIKIRSNELNLDCFLISLFLLCIAHDD